MGSVVYVAGSQDVAYTLNTIARIRASVARALA
jgi:hypothetical protein